MKKLFSLFFFLVFLNFQAQEVVFEKTLTLAFSKALNTKKLVFIEYYNSDCTVCKKIEPLFKEEVVGTFYNKNFVNYKMNTSNDLLPEEKELLEKEGLFFESVPFFLFFDPSSRKLVHYSGSKLEVNELIKIGKTALDEKERTDNLCVKYNSGDRSIRTLYAYANLLQLYKNVEAQNEVTKALFESFPKNELDTRKSYTVLKNVIISTDNGFFQFWIANLDKLNGFEEGVNLGREKEVLEKILLKELASPTIKNWPTQKKNQFKNWIKDLKITDNPEVYFE